MSYNYKDLNYRREALDIYEKHLCCIDINECDDDEAEELQDDILYTGRLKALTNRLIEKWEGHLMSERLVGNRPGRIEPRAVKRGQKPILY
ncbi:hypothetical protein SAMN02745866_02435 [Alteromonadaceae bacterium Bs31]|nr:hypothetical protein SAMN02745866_02435 [Alteromonadaceae bacterium Bs31]